MKTYHLLIIVGNNLRDAQVQADFIHEEAGKVGCYAFYIKNPDRLVACYPIARTIISKITENEK